MTNSKALAALVVETWSASGARTWERLYALIDFYATTYFGAAPRQPEIATLIANAKMIAVDRVRGKATA